MRRATELGLFLLVLLVPLLAVWGASSLAALWSGQRDLALVLGLSMFPLLPALWELLAWRRRQRAKVQRPRILTLIDRLTLRTLTISLVFLVPMALTWPAPLFQALTTRGDWFLDDVDASWAPSARSSVLRAADGLVWMFDAVHDNPWRDDEGASVVASSGTTPPPVPTRDAIVVTNPTTTTVPTPPPIPPPPPPTTTTEPTTPVPLSPDQWPFADTLHPLAHAPPEDALVSIRTLGHYYEMQIAAPVERAKAVHDFVADHVAYDVASYRSGHYPPQTAEATFRTHLSVCAGYARLFEALGNAAGLHVETVVGDARTAVADADGHAWNAIELDGAWWLVDTTWDAGTVDGDTFTPDYRSAYFLVPPAVLGVTHFPENERWQLVATPLTRGEWNRQPILHPDFFIAGLRLLSPDRAQVDGGPSVHAQLASEHGWYVMANAVAHEGGQRVVCDTRGGATVDVTCTLPSHGAWTFYLYASPNRYGTYSETGFFDVSYL